MGALVLKTLIRRFDAIRYLPKLVNGVLKFNADGELVADNGGFVLKAAAYTAVSGDILGVNTTAGALTITLPAVAEAGDEVEIFDPAGTWDTNNVTVARNGLKINSGTSDLTLSTEYGRVVLRYISAAIGWKAFYPGASADSLAVTNDLTVGGNASVTGTLDADGAATLGSVTADAATPFVSTATGKTNTGYVQVLGKTSGGLKRTVADASAYLVTESMAAQTVGVATLTIPDFANVNDTYAFITLAQTLSNKTLASPIISGVQRSSLVATPVAATGAGGGVAGAAAIGAVNFALVSSDGATKGVKLLTGVAGQVIQIINTSGTACNLFAAAGGTINGGAADAGCAIAASKGVICVCTAADTWTVFDMAAKAGAAA